jgi:acetylornithine deacetylase/succinyl-diaminopimelate desuccinylase-like protein
LASQTSQWEELLDRLAELPRENGSPELQRALEFLSDALLRAGADVERISFVAQPYALRMVGVVALVGGLLYARLARERRWWAALVVALSAPLLVVGQVDQLAPLLGRVGAQTQQHLVARVAAERVEQRLIFAAHYDTKTDTLDHVERVPALTLAAVVTPLAILAALCGALLRGPVRARGPRALLRLSPWLAVLSGALVFASLSAGAFAARRSPGALDDGAACAVLVRLVEALATGPALRRTEVEVLLFSAEEMAAQGSWVYARERFAAPPSLPTALVNLEIIGASADHAVLGSERFALRSFAPTPALVERLAAVHRATLGRDLAVTWYGGITDARSFLAHGIPAATLMSREAGALFSRSLHSADDERSRIDVAALESSLSFLLAFARDVDARGLPAASGASVEAELR